MRDTDPDITAWLNAQGEATGAHDGAIGNELFAWLYDDLHRIARQHMRKEQPGHALSSTALTHEAWFRMSEQTRTRWANRSHFLAVASTLMRRILVHHAVARRADKRQALLVSMTLADAVPAPAADDDIVAVHEALLAFERVDARAARVVELKFFGGMENTEIAEAMGLSPATVKREWNVARAWLMRELGSA
jgi:RNA polymerase sigma factor (TIGR02999 family)